MLRQRLHQAPALLEYKCVKKGIGDLKKLFYLHMCVTMYAGRSTKTVCARKPRLVRRDFSMQSTNIKGLRKVHDITKKVKHHFRLKDQSSKIFQDLLKYTSLFNCCCLNPMCLHFSLLEQQYAKLLHIHLLYILLILGFSYAYNCICHFQWKIENTTGIIILPL